MPARMRFGSLAINLIFNIALPLIAFNIMQAHGVRVVLALVISGVFPALEILYTWIRSRHLEPLGAISLTLIFIGAAASLISGDVHFALAKESLGTGIFGLLCLGSLLAPRPLMFFISRSFVSGGDPVRAAEWDDRWEYTLFRDAIRTITAVWGIAFVIEAAVRVGIVFVLPVNAVIVMSPLLALLTAVALVFWTIRYSNEAERRGEAEGVAAEAAAAEAIAAAAAAPATASASAGSASTLAPDA